MIRIIRGHNRLNGLKFSAAEFGLVGIVALALAASFVIAGGYLLAVVALGIAVNCVVVVVYALRSSRAGERDIGLRAMLSPAIRAAALREYPTMQRDSYILAGATMLPFVVAVSVAIESRVGRTKR